MLPLPGEVPLESCPYCIYYQQFGSEGDNPNEQGEEQRRGGGYCVPARCKSPCHCGSPGRSGPQASVPRMRLCRRCWAELRSKLDLIVASRYFSRGIMIAILINTLSMGIEYHEQVGLPPVCGCVYVCE